MSDPVLTYGGKGYLVDPVAGTVLPVDAKDVPDALAAGFAPAPAAAVADHRRREHYGSGGNAALAGVAALGRGLTLGLSDAVLTGSGAVSPETLAGLRDANPMADSGLSAIGAIGGTFLPGGPAALLSRVGAKAGTRAAAAVAGATGRSVGSALPRLAGTLTREGVIGAGFGAGSGLSAASLAGDDLLSPEAAAKIVKGAAGGAAVGGALGGLTWAAKTGALAARDRYSLGMGKIKALRGERDALTAEFEAAKASGAAPDSLASLEGRLAGVSSELQQTQVAAAGKILSKAASYAIGHAVGGGLAGGLVGVVVGPRAMKALAGALKPIGTKIAAGAIGEVVEAAAPYVSAAAAKAEQAAASAWSRIEPLAERVAQSPVFQSFAADAARETAQRAGAAATAGANRIASAVAEKFPYAERFAAKAAAAAGDVAAHVPDSVATGAMVGGLPGAAVGYAAHRLAQPIGLAVEGLINKVAPAGRSAVLSQLSRQEIRDVAAEISKLDPAALDTSIRLLLPESTPAELKTAVADRMGAAAAFLQKHADGFGGIAGAEQVPTELREKLDAQGVKGQRAELAVRAVVDPGSMLESFAAGKLDPVQVAAWEAVYPEALAQVRAVASAMVARTAAGGGRFTRDRAEQIAILQGSAAAAPRLYQPRTMARMQRMHAQSRASNRPGPRPRSGPSLAGNHLTEMQRLRRGG